MRLEEFVRATVGRDLDELHRRIDELPPRLDTRLLFPAPGGGLMNLDNFRRREWGPAVEGAGASPA